jgi:RNA polymerase sigma-70 factor, ECF subfamily
MHRFEALFVRQLDRAYNLACGIVREDQDAQDIVQEAYVRALKGFPGFRGGNPRAWLLTIVRNTAYTWTKKKRLQQEKIVPFDVEIHDATVEVAPSEESLESRRQLLEGALHRLPAEFREVLLLFELQNWSYKAIAAALGVPLGTVMSRLSRARRRLQQELARREDGQIGGDC